MGIFKNVKPPADLKDTMPFGRKGKDKLIEKCSEEGGSCLCGTGEGWVKYGNRNTHQGDIYTEWRYVKNRINCSNSTFGDPLVGFKKHCLC